MTEAGQVEQRRAQDPRLWLLLFFHACLFLFLAGASLLFASVQKVPWIADSRLCTGLLVVVVLALFGCLSRLALHRPCAPFLEEA